MIVQFAYRCKLCKQLIYRNTTRSANMYCDVCRKNSLTRCKQEDKNDKGKEVSH